MESASARLHQWTLDYPFLLRTCLSSLIPSWIIQELKYQHQIRECWFQGKGSYRANIIQLGRIVKSIELVVTNGTEGALCIFFCTDSRFPFFITEVCKTRVAHGTNSHEVSICTGFHIMCI